MSEIQKKFRPLVKRVNTIVIISLFIGISVVVATLAVQLINSRSTDTRENALDKGELTRQALQTFMLRNEADLSIEFLERIQKSELGNTIQVYRRDGTPAFTDDSTRKMVNSFLGGDQFVYDSMSMEKGVMDFRPVNKEYFDMSLSGSQNVPENVLFKESDGKKQYLTLYSPLINGPNCNACHGRQQTVRGVVGITYDLTELNKRQNVGIAITVIMFLVFIVIVPIFLTGYLKRKIISPVKLIGNVCLKVTEGDFSPRVSIKNSDEIGVLGSTVNTMVEGLHERFELSKFVSSSTIKSLRTDKKADKAELTMLFSDIRGFTSYSESHTPDEVVTHLNNLLNVQTEIIHDHGGDIDKYVGDEVVAVYSGSDSVLFACRSALEIQEKLIDSKEFDGLQVGIGINTGEVIFGMIGSEKRADYTVIGDNVNVAARLCGAAKSGQVIISESSYALVKDRVTVEGPFKLTVKGKSLKLKVYLITGITNE